MTIKDFAQLCGCNTQTLRYYDRIGLLKPVKVDDWSGYRYYDRVQAIDFIKIKNLQSADFTISEIKKLLTCTDQQVYDAFDAKIREQKQKLEQIQKIRDSYLKEKRDMEKMISSTAGFMLAMLGDPENLREFGIDPSEHAHICSLIRQHMEKMLASRLTDGGELSLAMNGEVYRDADSIAEKLDSLSEDGIPKALKLTTEHDDDWANNDYSEYDTIFERHGWAHMYDIIDELPELESDAEYLILIQASDKTLAERASFPMLMLGMLLLKNENLGEKISCTADDSPDNINHFTLMKRRNT